MFKRAKGFDNLIGPGVHLHGTMSLQSNTTTVLECTGSLERIARGDNFDPTVIVEVRNFLHVGEMDVGKLTVSSTLTVKGRITCDELIVTKTGRVIAESIEVTTLTIHPGAVVNARVRQGESDDPAAD